MDLQVWANCCAVCASLRSQRRKEKSRVLAVRMGVSLVILLAYLRQDSKITREDKERVWEQLGKME